jgi:hypothetical protein
MTKRFSLSWWIALNTAMYSASITDPIQYVPPEGLEELAIVGMPSY